MIYSVYAISSIEKNYIYVGLSSNIEERFKRRNLGYERTTKPYNPFSLIYSEECADRNTARKREKYWKSGAGKKKLRSIRKEVCSKE
jgi:putative endonuclease